MADSTAASGDTADKNEPVVKVAFKRRQNTNAKKGMRRRPATPGSSDSDSDSGDEIADTSRLKRRKKEGASATTRKQNNGTSDELFATVASAGRGPLSSQADEATKRTDWFDEKKTQGSGQEQKDAAKPGGRYGPMKAPTNVRTTTMMDFKPDVCKDYKKTGFCGYGDGCVFLHDREDYKMGWQLDREWEDVTKGRQALGGTIVSSADRNRNGGGDAEVEKQDAEIPEDIPFVCVICEKDYKSPIVTRCGHYFCEACALNRYRKDPTCAICGTGTNGTFNTAKTLAKLLQRKKAAQEAEEDSPS